MAPAIPKALAGIEATPAIIDITPQLIPTIAATDAAVSPMAIAIGGKATIAVVMPVTAAINAGKNNNKPKAPAMMPNISHVIAESFIAPVIMNGLSLIMEVEDPIVIKTF
jgi:hypothetical protein